MPKIKKTKVEEIKSVEGGIIQVHTDYDQKDEAELMLKVRGRKFYVDKDGKEVTV